MKPNLSFSYKMLKNFGLLTFDFSCEELMLLGFISLLLTVLEGPIPGICISTTVGATWHPCDKKSDVNRARTSTGAIYKDKCMDKVCLNFSHLNSFVHIS